MRGNERLLGILSALGAERNQTLSELADGLGLPRPTTLRFLRSLEEGHWVQRDDHGRYSLGLAVVTLSAQYLRTEDLLVVASQRMLELRDRTRESVSLSRRAGSRRVCVQEFVSPEPLRLILGAGQWGPLHAGASGLVLLSVLSRSRREELMVDRLERYTSATITSMRGLHDECERVAERGYAVTYGQRTSGGVAVAVPVRDPNASSGISALGIYAPEARATREAERSWIDELLQTARGIEEAATSLQSMTQ